MGQSKYQGALDTYFVDAFDEHNVEVREIRKELDLPSDARFCGFLIYIPETEEYLHEIDDSADEASRAFVSSPQQARRFSTFAEVRKLARRDRSEAIVAMFDLGQQHIMAVLMEGLPSGGATLH